MTDKKRNIVFDMGQVLMDFAPPTFIARLGYAGDDAQALLQEVFRGWAWVAFHRGDMVRLRRELRELGVEVEV